MVGDFGGHHLPSTLELQRACLDIYDKTRSFDAIARLCQSDEFTFEILMGPPIHKAPVFFIGYQPGDWELSAREARDEGYEKGWVKPISHYAVAKWPLAKKLREILGEDFLKNSVGTNAIFVRAKSVEAYTRDVPLTDRRKIQEFCVAKVNDLVKLIEPQRIIVLGLQTMDLLGPSHSKQVGPTGKTVTKIGTVGGQDALVVRHPTGAPFTRADWQMLVARMRDYCGLEPRR